MRLLKFNEHVTKEQLIDKSKGIDGFLNCQLFAQLLTDEPHLLELPKVNFKQMKVGDVMAFGGDETFSQHYSVYLGGGDTLEVDSWGKKPTITPLSQVLKYWEQPKSVHRPNYENIKI